MKYMGKITMLLRRPVVRESFPSPNLSCSSSVLMLPVPFVHQKTSRLRDCPHSTAPYRLPSVPTGALVLSALGGVLHVRRSSVIAVPGFCPLLHPLLSIF